MATLRDVRLDEVTFKIVTTPAVPDLIRITARWRHWFGWASELLGSDSLEVYLTSARYQEAQNRALVDLNFRIGLTYYELKALIQEGNHAIRAPEGQDRQMAHLGSAR